MKLILYALLIFPSTVPMVAKRSYFMDTGSKLLKGQMLVEEITPGKFYWVDSDGKTLMHYAATWDKSGTLIESLYHACPDLLEKKDKANYTPLHFAALHGNTIALAALIRCKANVMAKTFSGKTAAHLVMLVTDFSTIKKILMSLSDAGCPLNAQDAYGNTPLDVLDKQGNTQLYTYVANHLKLTGGCTTGGQSPTNP